MEPNIPTSFIPKRPIEPGATVSTQKTTHHFGAASFITIIIVVGTVVAAIGTYLYEANLNRQVTNAKASLLQARDGIGTDFVSNMKRLNDRITAVKRLLENHVVVTPIFQALEATTLRSVQYKNFRYALQSDATHNQKDVTVTLLGTTKSYATLALQSDAFLGNTLIKNPVFSALTVNDVGHTIDFTLKFETDAPSISYERFITSLAPQNNVALPNQ